MSAKLYCFCAAVLGGALGACLPAASGNEEQGMSSNAVDAAAPDMPLDIAINQFPGGYQGQWGANTADCAKTSENSDRVISLQGKLVKLHESIGTMTDGKRKTSRSMEASFDFIGENEKWTKSIAFELSEDRKILTRVDKDDGRTYRYVECPKLMAG